MEGSRLRPFLCVGVAYFLIAVIVPMVVLVTFGEQSGDWTLRGISWSVAAGVAGAVGALAEVGVVLVDRENQALADQAGLADVLLPGAGGAAGPSTDVPTCLQGQAGAAGYALAQACCVATPEGQCGGLDSCP